MAFPIRKKLSPKLGDMVPIHIPQHDPISKRVSYTSPKQLFSSMLNEALEG